MSRVTIVKSHGLRKTTDYLKIRKDIRVTNATNKKKAAQAIRYFDAIANEKGVTNSDLFTEVMKIYYEHTKHIPKKTNFRKSKKTNQ